MSQFNNHMDLTELFAILIIIFGWLHFPSGVSFCNRNPCLDGFYKTLLSWIIDRAVCLPVPYIDSFSEEEECMPYVMSSSSQDDFEKPSNWTHRSVSRPIVISNEPFRISSLFKMKSFSHWLKELCKLTELKQRVLLEITAKRIATLQRLSWD